MAAGGVLVPRERLIRRIVASGAQCVAVVGGPGMGKSTLLRQLATQHQGRVVTVACDPRDGDGVMWQRRLLDALGSGAGEEQTVADAARDALLASAPTEVLVLLDDAHHLDGEGGHGARALAEVARSLPANARLVVASRTPPARVVAAASELGLPLMLGDADLDFDDDEVVRIAGPAAAADADSMRWPVYAALSVAAGRVVAEEFVWHEVLAQHSDRERHLIAAVAHLGTIDSEVIEALGHSRVEATRLFIEVPFIHETEPGAWSVHSLWHDALAGELHRDARQEIDRAAADVARRRGDHDRAGELLIRAKAWDDVLALLVEVATDYSGLIHPEILRRWLRILPESCDHRPERGLLEAMLAMSGDIETARRLLADARLEFERQDHTAGELATIMQQTHVAVWQGDVQTMVVITDRVRARVDQGHTRFRPIEQFHRALMAHVSGQPDVVLDLVDQRLVGDLPGFEAVLHWLRGFARLDLGQPAEALAEGLAGLEADRGGYELPLQSLVLEARFPLDGAQAVLDELEHVLPRIEATGIDQFIGAAAIRLVSALAFVGRPTDARAALEQYAVPLATLDSPVFDVYAALAQASVHAAEGDVATAAKVLGLVCADYPTDDPRTRAVWSRQGAFVAALLPDVPVPIAGSGDHAGTAARLVEAVSRVRTGAPLAGSGLTPDEMRTANRFLPARWIADLAAASPARDARMLLEPFGARSHDLLREAVSARPDADLGGITSIAPRAPAQPLTIRLLGEVEVSIGATTVNHPALRRRRVRDLLALLVRHRSMPRRSAAAQLWPDLDPERSAVNLRVNLNHLLSVLEPDRERGEPSYFVRTHDALLVLASDGVTIDVDELEGGLATARRLETEGKTTRALDVMLDALGWWRGHPAVYDDAPWASEEVARLTQLFVRGAVRAADLLLAAGRPEEAHDLAVQAAAADDWDLEVCRVGGAAARALGDDSLARQWAATTATVRDALGAELDATG